MLDLKRVSHASIFLLFISLIKSLLSLALKRSIAQVFGADPATDAYFAALTIPQQFGDFLIGGILFMVIVPVFQKQKNNSGESEASEQISGLLKLMLILLLLMTTVYFLLIPLIIPALFPGFDKETIRQTIYLSKLFSPALLLMGMSLIYTAFYHSYRSFFVPALASLIFPTTSLISIWFLPASWGIDRLIYGNLTGVIISLVGMIFFIHNRLPWNWKNWSLFNPTSKEVMILVWPLFLSISIGRLVPVVQKSAASAYSGGISLLEYALFLSNFALGIVLAPLASSIFPLLSEQSSTSSSTEVFDTFNRSLKTIIFLVFPLFLLLFFQAENIIGLLFGYGKFTTDEVRVCGLLTAILAFTIIPLSVNRLTHQLFFALRKTQSISILLSINYILSIPVFLIMGKKFSLSGIAIAYLALQVSICLTSTILLKCKCPVYSPMNLIKSSGKLILTVLITTGIIYLLQFLLPEAQPPALKFCLNLIVLGAVYLITARLIRQEELNFILKRIPLMSRLFPWLTFD
jgi:putative peptidoglycan lipid II flippase